MGIGALSIFTIILIYNYSMLSGGVEILPLISHAEDWVLKSSLRHTVLATKL